MAERKARKAPKSTAGPGKMSGAKMHSIRGLALGRASGEFDRLIHERLRLAIVSALAVHDSLSFNDLKQMLDISDGNLSVHARKLEEAGYLTCTKSFEGRMPKTRYELTAAGRRSLERHLEHMEALIRVVRDKS
jgi:DNA-binding transcriptional ArsR family regulator